MVDSDLAVFSQDTANNSKDGMNVAVELDCAEVPSVDEVLDEALLEDHSVEGGFGDSGVGKDDGVGGAKLVNGKDDAAMSMFTASGGDSLGPGVHVEGFVFFLNRLTFSSKRWPMQIIVHPSEPPPPRKPCSVGAGGPAFPVSCFFFVAHYCTSQYP